MKTRFITIFLIFLLISCNTVDIKKIMNSWKGSHKKDLVLSWGPPARIASDGNGGEILIYSNHVYMPSFGLNYYENKMMYADANGIIYYWMIKNEEVPPTQIDLNIYRRK
ncbi:MAG: hypothetical protein NTW25_05080 [Candidatus Kapabacteria bacterium]|nr:hypothetical protein [Candidatus Kapabacteria bacterium]